MIFDRFASFLGEASQVLADKVPFKDFYYQHLEYSGCAVFDNLTTTPLPNLLSSRYPFLFSKGFDLSEEDRTIFEGTPFKGRFCQCLHNSSKTQTTANNDMSMGIEINPGPYEKQLRRLNELRFSNQMNSSEITKFLIDRDRRIRKLFDVWDRTLLKSMRLTSVGIAIGQSYIANKMSIDIEIQSWL